MTVYTSYDCLRTKLVYQYISSYMYYNPNGRIYVYYILGLQFCAHKKKEVIYNKIYFTFVNT